MVGGAPDRGSALLEGFVPARYPSHRGEPGTCVNGNTWLCSLRLKLGYLIDQVYIVVLAEEGGRQALLGCEPLIDEGRADARTGGPQHVDQQPHYSLSLEHEHHQGAGHQEVSQKEREGFGSTQYVPH